MAATAAWHFDAKNMFRVAALPEAMAAMARVFI
jgi:hypothetical protein